MAQEHHVLSCFSCKTFQSHIVKKTNKWECKICGAKQSIRKVYGRGTGKDCRLHTQKLNALKGQKEEIKYCTEHAEETNKSSGTQVLTNQHISFAGGEQFSKTSKWAEFIDQNEADTYKNSLEKPENSNLSRVKLLENKAYKRKINETFEFIEDTEVCNYSDNFDSFDSPYSTSRKRDSGKYIKRKKFNKFYSSHKNFCPSNAVGDFGTQRIQKNLMSKPYLKNNTMGKTDIKADIKWHRHLEDISSRNMLNGPSSKNAKKLEKCTEVSLKWQKYLEDEYVMNMEGTPTKICTRHMSGNRRAIQVEEGPQEKRRVPLFGDSEEFERISSGTFRTSKIVSNTIVSLSDLNGPSINPQEKNSIRNQDNSFNFDLKNQFKAGTSIGESSEETDISIKKQPYAKKSLYLPVFEKNFDLSDSDFQLDF